MTPYSQMIAHLLLNEGIGFPIGQNWEVRASYLPDEGDNAFCIYDTAPKMDGRLMTSGESILHPGIQVFLRSTEYLPGWAKMQQVLSLVDSLKNTEISISSAEVYIVKSAMTTSGVLFLGRETDTTKKRNLFSLNFVMTL